LGARKPIGRFVAGSGASMSFFTMLIDGVDFQALLLLLAFEIVHPARQILMGSQHLAKFNKARMIRMFICTARSLFRTDESIATPCSVKA
jgi:hypothetical protein